MYKPNGLAQFIYFYIIYKDSYLQFDSFYYLIFLKFCQLVLTETFCHSSILQTFHIEIVALVESVWPGLVVLVESVWPVGWVKTVNQGTN